MTQNQKIEQLLALKAETRLGGGLERIEAQHKRSRMTARERIDLLVDQVIVAGRATKCPVCSALIGKVYKIDDVPESPPHPCCVHDLEAYRRKWLVLQ